LQHTARPRAAHRDRPRAHVARQHSPGLRLMDVVERWRKPSGAAAAELRAVPRRSKSSRFRRCRWSPRAAAPHRDSPNARSPRSPPDAPSCLHLPRSIRPRAYGDAEPAIMMKEAGALLKWRGRRATLSCSKKKTGPAKARQSFADQGTTGITFQRGTADGNEACPDNRRDTCRQRAYTMAPSAAAINACDRMSAMRRPRGRKNQ
jgi:hypothetical protein